MRIVSLCPSLTELVFDLGRGPELVGITEFCVHPANGVAGLEKVGGTKTPNIARITALAPDVVLMNEEENRKQDAEALRAAGIDCHVSMPRDCNETAAMVRAIGARLERTSAADAIAHDIEARAARVARDSAGRSAVSFAYLIWRKPWMSVNADTFASGLLALAGGRNVFADLPERYPEITIDSLIRAAPAVVFLCTEPFPFQSKHIDELAAATGFARERFVIADGEYLSWHGSRTPDGIDYAERLIAAAAAGPIRAK
ncbi:MAG: cobalamin-binding protein [Planctomycetes bacterium]|nr:cobalamin-binding protein [Planctomycetota bacterium]